MLSQSIGLTDKLFEALKNDPRTKDAVVDIAFNQGIVTLSGTVKSHTTMNAVEEIAKKQPGVISVINEVKVI
jgi:osmotically-inducible protein OsmY